MLQYILNDIKLWGVNRDNCTLYSALHGLTIFDGTRHVQKDEYFRPSHATRPDEGFAETL